MSTRAGTISLQLPHTCWICGQEVELETCKIDECGLAVHERCQTLRLIAQNGKVPSSAISRPQR